MENDHMRACRAGRMGEAGHARNSNIPFERYLVCLPLFKPPLLDVAWPLDKVYNRCRATH
jgi:hypothetical protein